MAPKFFWVMCPLFGWGNGGRNFMNTEDRRPFHFTFFLFNQAGSKYCAHCNSPMDLAPKGVHGPILCIPPYYGLFNFCHVSSHSL